MELPRETKEYGFISPHHVTRAPESGNSPKITKGFSLCSSSEFNVRNLDMFVQFVAIIIPFYDIFMSSIQNTNTLISDIYEDFKTVPVLFELIH